MCSVSSPAIRNLPFPSLLSLSLSLLPCAFVHAVEAAARRRTDVDPADLAQAAYGAIVLSDTRDQYALFRHLGPFLHNPPALQHQDIFPLSEDDRRHLLFSYYQYDAELMLLILGKQMSKSMRKDLDELADETQLALSSCYRQFDNLRRIFKTVEDQPGPLAHVIQQQFLLNPSQARLAGWLVERARRGMGREGNKHGERREQCLRSRGREGYLGRGELQQTP